MEAWKGGRVGGWKAVRCLTWRAAVPRSGEWETDSGRLVSSSEAAIQESLGRQALGKRPPETTRTEGACSMFELIPNISLGIRPR